MDLRNFPEKAKEVIEAIVMLKQSKSVSPLIVGPKKPPKFFSQKQLKSPKKPLKVWEKEKPLEI